MLYFPKFKCDFFQPEIERDDDSLSGAENNATLEDAVEKTLDALATGDSDMIRKFSDAS